MREADEVLAPREAHLLTARVAVAVPSTIARRRSSPILRRLMSWATPIIRTGVPVSSRSTRPRWCSQYSMPSGVAKRTSTEKSRPV